jgi:phenol 2-monooxygenase
VAHHASFRILIWVSLRYAPSNQAVVKTNMPSPRSLNSVQSAEHGLLLWCPIDGGRTRIGYVFSEKLQQKWGTVDGEGVSEEAIMEEARLAMKPFDLEFEKVDWFTIYVGGQGRCRE